MGCRATCWGRHRLVAVRQSDYPKLAMLGGGHKLESLLCAPAGPFFSARSVTVHYSTPVNEYCILFPAGYDDNLAHLGVSACMDCEAAHIFVVGVLHGLYQLSEFFRE